jgi:uncharacterized membrane protein YhaH (DUF805 family)
MTMLTNLGRRLFSFKGRITRSAFWCSALLLGGAFVVLFVFLDHTAGRASTLVLYPPFFWAMAALAVKRLRDRGKHPAWLAVLLIPVLGPLWALIALGLKRGTPGENQYGPDPLEFGADYLTVK